MDLTLASTFEASAGSFMRFDRVDVFGTMGTSLKDTISMMVRTRAASAVLFYTESGGRFMVSPAPPNTPSPKKVHIRMFAWSHVRMFACSRRPQSTPKGPRAATVHANVRIYQ